MKTFICSHTGTTEYCSGCYFCVPSSNYSALNCSFQVAAKHEIMEFPLYYQKENSFFLIKSSSSAVKFTIHTETFFASVINDEFQIADLFLTAQKITEEMFETNCISFVKAILSEANLEFEFKSIEETSESFF